MKQFIQFLVLSILMLISAQGFSKESNSSMLHLQVFNEGVCSPMLRSPSYTYFRYRYTKHIFQSGSYYSTIYAYINSKDSGELYPQTHHQSQSGSIQLNPNLNYELVLVRYSGFNKSNPDSMVIQVSRLSNNAQLMIPFKKGKYKLRKMKHFKELSPKALPNFSIDNRPKITLKKDSTTYYNNGKTKAIYYLVAPGYPLYYVQKFNPINPTIVSQGYQLLTHYTNSGASTQQVLWNSRYQNKYGYWEYYENGKRTKHEMWAAVLQAKYEWYTTGQLKYAKQQTGRTKEMTHRYYNKNGRILEEYYAGTSSILANLKVYTYSLEGQLMMVNIYNSSNGITKQGLQKRMLYYPSGKLKMEENFLGTYYIKYYTEDGK